MNLENKVTYITGGSKGIGLGVAQSLLSKGMKVAISGRNEASLKEALKQLGNSEGILAIKSDVTILTDEEKAVETILHHWGQLDVVIANAG
ncbi:MAG: SDR family NAD(P)-dependent oxidoreductase, partial [Bacteroidota bacterium]